MSHRWAAPRTPPLRARTLPSHTYCCEGTQALSLCPSSHSLACLEDSEVTEFAHCLATQHEVNFSATIVLKERETLRSTGDAPARQASAYHAYFNASSTPVTRPSSAYPRVLGGFSDGSHAVRAGSLQEPDRSPSGPQPCAFDGRSALLIDVHARARTFP